MQDSAQLRRLDQVRVRVVAARVEERRVLEEGSAPAGEILRLYGRIAETTSALGHRGRHARKNQSWAESPTGADVRLWVPMGARADRRPGVPSGCRDGVGGGSAGGRRSRGRRGGGRWKVREREP